MNQIRQVFSNVMTVFGTEVPVKKKLTANQPMNRMVRAQIVIRAGLMTVFVAMSDATDFVNIVVMAMAE